MIFREMVCRLSLIHIYLAFQPISEEERRRIVSELESFDGDHKFSDMDPEKAASCGGEIRDAYDFVGRETEKMCIRDSFRTLSIRQD